MIIRYFGGDYKIDKCIDCLFNEVERTNKTCNCLIDLTLLIKDFSKIPEDCPFITGDWKDHYFSKTCRLEVLEVEKTGNEDSQLQ